MSNPRPRLLYVAALAAILALPTVVHGNEASANADTSRYTLRYKFQLNETLRWEVVHQAKVRTSVAGTTQTAETVSKSVKAWRVTDVKPSGEVTFEHLVENVDMWQKLTGRQEIRYNSQTDPEPPPGFENVAESVGVPISIITMDATGNILRRTGKSKAQTTQNEGHITIPLPKGPVIAGENWTFPYQIDVPVGTSGAIKKIKTVQKYTLVEVKTGIAVIQVVTQFLTPIHDPAIEAQVLQRQAAGTVRFDIDAGRVLRQQLDLDKQVVGFSGEASSLHYLTRFTENLLPESSRTATRTNTDAPKTE